MKLSPVTLTVHPITQLQKHKRDVALRMEIKKTQ